MPALTPQIDGYADTLVAVVFDGFHFTQPHGDGLTIALAYFGVGATPVRARQAETALTNGDIESAVKALGHDLDPPSDVHSTSATKRHLAGVLLRKIAKQLGT